MNVVQPVRIRYPKGAGSKFAAGGCTGTCCQTRLVHHIVGAFIARIDCDRWYVVGSSNRDRHIGEIAQVSAVGDLIHVGKYHLDRFTIVQGLRCCLGGLIHREGVGTVRTVNGQSAVLIGHSNRWADNRQSLAVYVGVVGEHVARYSCLVFGQAVAIVCRDRRVVVVNDGHGSCVVDQGCTNRIAQDNREGLIAFNQRVAHDGFVHGKTHCTCRDGYGCRGGSVKKVGRVAG